MVDVKRIFVFVLIGMFLVSLMGVVVGETPGEDLPNARAAGEGAKALWSGGASFFQALFADTIIGDEILSRIFMAVLLAMFVYTAFGSFFSENENIRWVATIATVALALIGLPDTFLEAIRTSYAAMGGAILSVIPFLVILWFTVKVKSILIARTTWLFFTLYYFALYISKIGAELAEKGSVAFFEGAATPYGIAMIAGFIAFFVIFRVRYFIFKGEMEAVKESGTHKAKERKVRLALEMKRLKADEGV